MRKLFVTSNRSFCRKTLMPTEKTNTGMPLGKRIDIIDSYEWEHFRMMVHPILKKVEFDSYPTLIIDGFKVTSPLSKRQFKAFLDGFTKQDKII